MGSKLFVLPSDSINTMVVRFQENAFFAQWCGVGRNNKEIISWWTSSFPSLITVRPLQNDFFLLECVDSSLKKVITEGCPLFFQGSSFNFINWKPGFDSVNHRFEKSPVWLSLVGLPLEFWCPEALVKIGDALGTLVGIEEDFLKGLKGDVANIYVEIDLHKGFYNFLEIISEMERWKQKVQRLGNHIPGKCIL